uniref:G_PROTEIN_RECEP_F1_2 domain-containing protein n=1 Tax=Meloidogyne incognita TaxID=6306 RepID=A0A914MME3_MELIC
MGVGYLPILFVGLISDMISIRVFSAKSMRTRQINLYLLLISITDMLILLDTTVSFTAVGFGYLIKWKWLVETRQINYFLIFLIIILILK